MVSAFTLTSTGEAIGIVQAARAAGLPVTISFTVETDGRLADGLPLAQAISEVDRHASPDYFMVNCAHPAHLAPALAEPGPGGSASPACATTPPPKATPNSTRPAASTTATPSYSPASTPSWPRCCRRCPFLAAAAAPTPATSPPSGAPAHHQDMTPPEPADGLDALPASDGSRLPRRTPWEPC
jgi:hypothetical protein